MGSTAKSLHVNTTAQADLGKYVLHVALVITAVHMYRLDAGRFPAVIQILVCCCVAVSCAIVQLHSLAIMGLHCTSFAQFTDKLDSLYTTRHSVIFSNF